MLNSQRYVAPRRFAELDLKLKFQSEEAKTRLIKRIQDAEGETIDLAKVMIGVKGEDVQLRFPPHAELPVANSDITDIEMEQLAELVDDDKVLLTVDYSLDEWVLDSELREPVKLKDLSPEDQAKVK